MTVIVNLPQPLDKVSQLMTTLGRLWPEAGIDTTGQDGWEIRIGEEQ